MKQENRRTKKLKVTSIELNSGFRDRFEFPVEMLEAAVLSIQEWWKDQPVPMESKSHYRSQDR